MKTQLLKSISILLFLVFATSTSDAQTDVSGTISQNTNWTKSGSPYRLSGTITLSSGIVLNIDSGVNIVFQEGAQFYVGGSFRGNGESSDKISVSRIGDADTYSFYFPNTYSDSSFFTHMNFNNMNRVFSTAGINPTGDVAGHIEVSNCEFVNVKHFIYVASEYFNTKFVVKSCKFNNCENFTSGLITDYSFTNNTVLNSTGSIIRHWPWNSKTEIKNNLFAGNNYDGGDLIMLDFIYAHADIVISNNIFFNNSAHGLIRVDFRQMSSDSDLQITNNLFLDNSLEYGLMRFSAPSWQTTINELINNNSFINNNGYALRTSITHSNITAANNWWDTQDTTVIHSKYIYDFNDDLTLGKVIVSPLLVASAIESPPMPFELVYPRDSSIVEISTDNNWSDTLTFAWNEAIEPDGDAVTYDIELTGDLNVLNWHLFDHCDKTKFMCAVPNHRIEDFLSIEGVEVVSGTWSVIATDGKGYSYPTNGPFKLTIDASRVSVDEPMLIPETFALHANYPNPFNPTTTISYDLPKRSQVTLGIYDLLGKQIKTLVNQSQDAGNRIAVWDGTDNLGRQVSAGVYLYQIQAGEFSQTRKMLLLK